MSLFVWPKHIFKARKKQSEGAEIGLRTVASDQGDRMTNPDKHLWIERWFQGWSANPQFQVWTEQPPHNRAECYVSLDPDLLYRLRVAVEEDEIILPYPYEDLLNDLLEALRHA